MRHVEGGKDRVRGHRRKRYSTRAKVKKSIPENKVIARGKEINERRGESKSTEHGVDLVKIYKALPGQW